jgi:O-acetyl-ADP-ribose deacetylase (regulator of RNase III)
MRATIGNKSLELIQGDITEQPLDAVVNAGNSALAGGGGVDGAIHRRGGPSIMQETRRKYPGGCPTGSAVISTAGDLPARYVVHAVGPIWRGGMQGEAELLASAYRSAIALAEQHDCQSIAFPSLSTGAYAYPVDLAARIALSTVIEALGQQKLPLLARFVLFDAGALGAYAAALEELQGS